MKTQINLFHRSLPVDPIMIGNHHNDNDSRFKNRNEDTHIPIIHPDSNDPAIGIIACFIISILFSIVFILFSK